MRYVVVKLTGKLKYFAKARIVFMIKKITLVGRLRSDRKPKAVEKPVSAKETIDLLTSFMTAITRASIFIGFFALAIYLGAARHVVTGVNLSDVFLLATLALALGLLGLLVVFIGVMLVGIQSSFLVSVLTFDGLIALKRNQMWLMAVFGIGVVIYTIFAPIGFLYFLEHGYAGFWTLFAINSALAIVMAFFWAWFQNLRLESLVDLIFTVITTSGLLVMSSLMCLMLLAYLSREIVVAFAVLGGMCAFGFQISVTTGKRAPPKRQRLGGILMVSSLFASILTTSFIPAFDGSTGLLKAFQMVALNVPGATVDVSVSNLQRLEKVSELQALPLPICRHADGTATLTDVRVLWHTLGSVGLVELWSEPTDPQRYSSTHRPRFQRAFYEQLFRPLGWSGIRVPLDNTGLSVMTGSNLHCVELNGLHFESNSASLSESAQNDLSKQLETIKQNLNERKSKDGKPLSTATRLAIVGHADPRARQVGTNEQLAYQRAKAVEKAVRSWLDQKAPEWASMDISIRSESAREQFRKCDIKNAAESEACNAFNRRVVLQLTSGPTSELK